MASLIRAFVLILALAPPAGAARVACLGDSWSLRVCEHLEVLLGEPVANAAIGGTTAGVLASSSQVADLLAANPDLQVIHLSVGILDAVAVGAPPEDITPYVDAIVSQAAAGGVVVSHVGYDYLPNENPAAVAASDAWHAAMAAAASANPAWRFEDTLGYWCQLVLQGASVVVPEPCPPEGYADWIHLTGAGYEALAVPSAAAVPAAAPVLELLAGGCVLGLLARCDSRGPATSQARVRKSTRSRTQEMRMRS